MTIQELIRMLQEEPDKTLKVYLLRVDRYDNMEAKNLEYGEDNDGREVLIIK